jgi:type II secretory pathway component PulK
MKRSPIYLQRTGAVLAIALTMVLVIGLLLGSLLQRVVREQRQMRVRHYQWQAQWLARSAMERAQAQLARDPEYTGETWQPDVAEEDGEVVIEVDKDGAEGRVISVTAHFPAAQPLRARFQYQQPYRGEQPDSAR